MQCKSTKNVYRAAAGNVLRHITDFARRYSHRFVTKLLTLRAEVLGRWEQKASEQHLIISFPFCFKCYFGQPNWQFCNRNNMTVLFKCGMILLRCTAPPTLHPTTQSENPSWVFPWTHRVLRTAWPSWYSWAVICHCDKIWANIDFRITWNLT